MSVLIIYWSGTGNTEIMANKMYEGVKSSGTLCTIKTVDSATIKDIKENNHIMFGCPSMGIEELEEEDFEPFFQSIEGELKDKKVALFGSYGWGDGEWLIDWENRVKKLGAKLFENGVKVNSTPSTSEEGQCFEFGARFANF